MVKESLSVILDTDCELLWLELYSQSGSILFVIFYHSPNSEEFPS